MKAPQTLPRWLDGVPVVIAAVLMLTWTWRTWPDPLVDFGRELYVPWRITLGQALYRDIAYLNGPFSPYLNAALMRVFGVSLTTIFAANIVLFAAALFLIYMLFKALADRFTAVAAAMVFVAVSGFGRLTKQGSYNFVSPYSHEITHGLVLSLGALACLHLPRRIQRRNVICTGLLLGLVLLTKVEIALACVVAVAAGFAVRLAAEQVADRVKLATILVAAAITPGAVSFGFLWSRMPASTALKGTLGSIYWAASSNVSSSQFYRAGFGTDHLRMNVTRMLVGVALVAVAALGAYLAGFLVARFVGGTHSRAAAIVAFTVTAGLGLRTVPSWRWFFNMPKGLPLVIAFSLIISVWLRARNRGEVCCQRLDLRVALTVFALALLVKMALNVRLYDYGFVLAVPALLLLVEAFLSSGPRVAERCRADRAVVRAIGAGLVTVFLIGYVNEIRFVLEEQRHLVGSGQESFLADERGPAVQEALRLLETRIPPGATVAVLPEGAMINYLSRRINPTPHVNFMPPELMMFGEDRVIRDFQNSPPDFVLLCHKDTAEYGARLFGQQYGKHLLVWVRDNYSEVAQIGHRPLERPGQFGMLLLQRRTLASAQMPAPEREVKAERLEGAGNSLRGEGRGTP